MSKKEFSKAFVRYCINRENYKTSHENGVCTGVCV